VNTAHTAAAAAAQQTVNTAHTAAAAAAAANIYQRSSHRKDIRRPKSFGKSCTK